MIQLSEEDVLLIRSALISWRSYSASNARSLARVVELISLFDELKLRIEDDGEVVSEDQL